MDVAAAAVKMDLVTDAVAFILAEYTGDAVPVTGIVCIILMGMMWDVGKTKNTLLLISGNTEKKLKTKTRGSAIS